MPISILPSADHDKAKLLAFIDRLRAGVESGAVRGIAGALILGPDKTSSFCATVCTMPAVTVIGALTMAVADLQKDIVSGPPPDFLDPETPN